MSQKERQKLANRIIYQFMYQLDPLDIMMILDRKGLLRDRK